MNSGTDTLQVFGQLKPDGLLRHDVMQAWIDPDYFRTLGTRIDAGRAFDAHDVKDSAAVAIVDEELAHEYFPNVNPIGRRIQIASGMSPWLVVIGVAAAQKHTTVYREMQWVAQPTVFRPITQGLSADLTLVARVNSEDLPFGAALRKIAASIDSGMAVGDVKTMRQQLGVYLAYPRFRAVVLGGFAAFALMLAMVGLHGVLGQMVSQRTQEIGVRMALGARPADVARMVARQGGAPVLAGLAIGMAVTLWLGRFLASLLYGVEPQDPATPAAVCLLLLTVAGVAMVRPARRAARIDPMAALRQE
jgi:putative ABC transport system permease protein